MEVTIDFEADPEAGCNLQFPKSGLKDYLKTGAKVDLFSLRKTDVAVESGWQNLKLRVKVDGSNENGFKMGNYTNAEIGAKKAAAVPSTGTSKAEVSGRRNGVLLNLKPT